MTEATIFSRDYGVSYFLGSLQGNNYMLHYELLNSSPTHQQNIEYTTREVRNSPPKLF